MPSPDSQNISHAFSSYTQAEERLQELFLEYQRQGIAVLTADRGRKSEGQEAQARTMNEIRQIIMQARMQFPEQADTLQNACANMVEGLRSADTVELEMRKHRGAYAHLLQGTERAAAETQRYAPQAVENIAASIAESAAGALRGLYKGGRYLFTGRKAA